MALGALLTAASSVLGGQANPAAGTEPNQDIQVSTGPVQSGGGTLVTRSDTPMFLIIAAAAVALVFLVKR